MYDDVSQLRDFYASPLGQLARRIIARRIRDRWDNVSNMDVIIDEMNRAEKVITL